MMRKIVYWLGAGAVAAAAAWAVWLSWHTSPAADPQTVTNRVRVLVGTAALVVLPWVAGGTVVRPGRQQPHGAADTGLAAWARSSCGWTVTLASAPMARARSACRARSPHWRCSAPGWPR